MDWRQAFAVASTGVFVGMAAFGVCTAVAADAVTPSSDSSAPLPISSDIVSSSGTMQQSSDAMRDPGKSVNGTTPTTSAYLVGVTAATDVSPEPLPKAEGSEGPAYLPKARSGCLQPFLHSTSDPKSKTRSCLVFEKGTPVIARRPGTRLAPTGIDSTSTVVARGAPRTALLLGVGF